MAEELFRKKSLERIQSPESLNDYVRVSNPGVWLLLICIVLLLIGVCIWGFFGHVDIVAQVDVHVEDGSAVCYLDEDNLTDVTIGTVVRFSNTEGTVSEIGEKSGELYACKLIVEECPADGIYPGELVRQSITPKSFVLN